MNTTANTSIRSFVPSTPSHPDTQSLVQGTAASFKRCFITLAVLSLAVLSHRPASACMASEPASSAGNSHPVSVIGARFSLASVGNPSTGALRVSVALPDSKPASLDVFDVTGRLISTRRVGGQGGFQSLKLADGMAPGFYVVRLLHEGRSVMTRITVVR